MTCNCHDPVVFGHNCAHRPTFNPGETFHLTLAQIGEITANAAAIHEAFTKARAQPAEGLTGRGRAGVVQPKNSLAQIGWNWARLAKHIKIYEKLIESPPNS